MADVPDAAAGGTPHYESGSVAGPAGQAVPEADSDSNQNAYLSAPAESSAVPDVSAAPLASPPVASAHTSSNGDVQAPVTNSTHAKPLQAEDSIASTVPDTGNKDLAYASFNAAVIDEEEQHDVNQLLQEPTQLEEPQDEQNESDAAAGNAVDSSAYGEPSNVQAAGKLGKTASANRLSVAYASGTRRMVIDAEIVDKLKVIRADGRIEVLMNVDKEDATTYKGILMETYSETTASYIPLEMPEIPEADPTVPPFSKVALPSKMTLIAYLDRDRPFSEPRWVKTGDVQEWLKSMFGRMFWVAGDAAEGWEKKIEVVDPDPAPTIWTILEAWAQNSNVGQTSERQRFLRTHMTETDNILEILLRLVRGERSGPAHPAPTPALAQPHVAGPLLGALSPGAAHGAQQTHVSLAVLAIFRIAVEYAKRADPGNGKHEVEERAGDVIRSLPSHLLYKSLDGIFKEWKVEKKGGR
ncbi:uncharacterized protein LAESUDRAFT_639859 [Laetiporus sulphureus 93-53]|uniref:Uncharacterized protein n=1 Tax=Laetiporus sulphureus 93-53 TaxID=1314785 RepID=A0A165IJ59_9APHY|nr:uncharacterized protein LAESUDRAFT_639859 [Laetiporus sulphureus 93-53]KZT13151.1 hypothetical protein LAESUDRAFT_639859 [Laetiporus sulphureus 93-53]